MSDQLSPEEIRHAVWSIKNNFRGKFEDQGEQDLYSCLQLFAKQGLASEDNVTLLEGFLSPKASNKESLKEKNQQFKENRQQEGAWSVEKILPFSISLYRNVTCSSPNDSLGFLFST